MTITIDLSAEAATDLLAYGRPAADAEELPLDADALEKIRRGFADMDAGRTVSLESSRTRIEALLAARHGSTGR